MSFFEAIGIVLVTIIGIFGALGLLMALVSARPGARAQSLLKRVQRRFIK
ncbi:hypothetical protein [Larsenimonas salina]|nr:hypothetical protein [Larsenimonas salina]MCM5704274.1 hypothetical protein [Larsenimonas salina]